MSVNSIHLFHLHYAGTKMKKTSNETGNYSQNSLGILHIYLLLFLFPLLNNHCHCLCLYFSPSMLLTAFGICLVTLRSYTASAEDNAVTSAPFNGLVPRPNLLTFHLCLNFSISVFLIFSLLLRGLWLHTLPLSENLSTADVFHLYSIAFLLFNYVKSSGK